MAKNRSRRLRKKLHVGEFAVFGFEFSCELNAFDEEKVDTLVDDFISFIEPRKLMMGGGVSEFTFEAFVCGDGSPCSELDRIAVGEWLENHSLCKKVVLGHLVNAYYPESI
ncbi:YggL family protein [Plesiomonas shigelloides]|uniref:YggL 50S ribosome-binding family protein n=1 Tax=Plesiomonas shigelloides TaxID=703 RepID=UPI0005601815|nr:50S ribosome-binding protein YggL [Plesiomonas shigelloides]KAB7654255.1 DUF469 family protein [Plesiomonas shigelloides]MBW3794600.1 DUF469 family protein [Plesiomonas shigelloides]MBW3794625.1 DUF469 family protein [Plesiomonas shigelloides]MCQ8860096.1 YggL family protein [Plesiomonas shigelloides]MDT1012256.1 50S ribosome-binding protein YggL [Plesiomonas shigelloides]